MSTGVTMEFDALALFWALADWVESTNRCTPFSHALLYSIAAMSVMISVGGIYVWRRFIRSQPVVKVGVE